MPKRVLKTVTRSQGANLALKNGQIGLPDFELDFEEVNPLPRAFRRMVREEAYDVSEMALTTYITARAYGAPLTALPIFLVRDFHHQAIVVSDKAGIGSPKALEGGRVGVKRGFTVTTGVWARAILAEEHGVDLSHIRWMRSDDEHVEGWRLPANVEDLEGAPLETQLAEGDLPAAVGLVAEAGMQGLIDAPFEAGLSAWRERGLYPINHLIVVRDALLAEAPDLAVQLFDAFAGCKRGYVNALKAGRANHPLHEALLADGADPLPYGIAPNLAVLERLMGHAVAQGIIDAPIPLPDLFAAETLDLVA